MSYYDSGRALADYLLFHYGTARQTLPFDFDVPGFDYLPRLIRIGLKDVAWPADARALDLGCAVGRASFELARHAAEVVGIDRSERFIAEAQQLQRTGRAEFDRIEEGERTTRCHVVVPPEIDRDRVHFQQGDALALPEELGRFDVIVAANVLDRLPAPGRFLDHCHVWLKPGGYLLLASPYTWSKEYTPRAEWLGGREEMTTPTGERIAARLRPQFQLVKHFELPFLLREHARKYQWSVAEVQLFRQGSKKALES